MKPYQAILTAYLSEHLMATTTRWQPLRTQINEQINHYSLPTHIRLAACANSLSALLQTFLSNPLHTRFSHSRSRLKVRLQQFNTNLSFLGQLEEDRRLLDFELIKTKLILELKAITTEREATKKLIIQKMNEAKTIEDLTAGISSEINQSSRRWQPWFIFKGSRLRAELIKIQEKLKLLNEIQKTKQEEIKYNFKNYQAEDLYIDSLISEILPSIIKSHSAIEDHIQHRILTAESKIIKQYAADKPKAARAIALFQARLAQLNQLFKINLTPTPTDKIKKAKLPDSLDITEKLALMKFHSFKTEAEKEDKFHSELNKKIAAIKQRNQEIKQVQADYKKIAEELNESELDLKTIQREQNLILALEANAIKNKKNGRTAPIHFYEEKGYCLLDNSSVQVELIDYADKIARDFLDRNHYQDIDWITDKLFQWTKLNEIRKPSFRTHLQDYAAKSSPQEQEPLKMALA